MRIYFPKKDITDFIIRFLKTHAIKHYGKPPLLSITCPFEKSHYARLDTKTGFIVCGICRSWGDFNTLQRRFVGRVEIDIKHTDGLSSKLGVLQALNGRLSQGEIEAFVSKAHEQLLQSQELMQFLMDKAKLEREPIEAFRLGWTGDKITDQRLKTFGNCFLVPIISPEGYYKGLRFSGLRSLHSGDFSFSRGVGGNETFWATTRKGKSRFWIVERIYQAIRLAQTLAISNGNNISIISPTAGETGIPREWRDKRFFGKKPVTYFFHNCAPCKRNLILARKLLGRATKVVNLIDKSRKRYELTDYLDRTRGSDMSDIFELEGQVEYT